MTEETVKLQSQLIISLQKQIRELIAENNSLKEQNEELRHEIQLLEAINLTIRRN